MGKEIADLDTCPSNVDSGGTEYRVGRSDRGISVFIGSIALSQTWGGPRFRECLFFQLT